MMSRRVAKGRVKHGAAVDAPSEYGFVTSDSPPPGSVAERQTRATGVTARRDPWATLWSGLKLSIGFAIVVSISVAIAWGAHRYALTTPRFNVKEFDVRGNRHFSAGEIARLAGVERGLNLFAVDTDAAEARLLESPWVRRAKISRALPGTLRIEVAEREAAAVASIEDGLYLVTPEGEPFKAVEPHDPVDLPVLTGVSARDLAVDRARAVERLGLGLEILREYDSLPVSRTFELEEAHLSSDGSVVLTVGKRGTTLHLGTGPFRQKLLMAARIVARLSSNGEMPGIVFLDNEAHPERVVVRMR
jgi:cell division protein FtsQ